MGAKKFFESVTAEATTRFYKGVPVNIAIINGVEYIGQQNIFHATSVDVSSAVVKHCRGTIKYVNGRKSFPIKDFSKMSFSTETMREFIQWLLTKQTETRSSNLKVAPIVPIHSKNVEVVYKTPPQMYEYIEDMLDENKAMRKHLEENVASLRTTLKEVQVAREGLYALKEVLISDDEAVEFAEKTQPLPNTIWLQNIEWDYLSPSNFAKLWGVHELVETINVADKDLNVRGKNADSSIWMSFSAKVGLFANKHNVQALKSKVSNKVKHKYNKSKKVNIYPIWFLETYFIKHYEECRNQSIPQQRRAVDWVENSINKSNGCGGKLRAVV